MSLDLERFMMMEALEEVRQEAIRRRDTAAHGQDYCHAHGYKLAVRAIEKASIELEKPSEKVVMTKNANKKLNALIRKARKELLNNQGLPDAMVKDETHVNKLRELQFADWEIKRMLGVGTLDTRMLPDYLRVRSS